ncbi:MAG: hypothetical protein M0P69_22040 [Bacteroidales bacterium]|nr:hypothetical protein [Bacteroidales bacterium]
MRSISPIWEVMILEVIWEDATRSLNINCGRRRKPWDVDIEWMNALHVFSISMSLMPKR